MIDSGPHCKTSAAICNLQLCLPSLALFSQLELMEPSPSFSEGIAFDSVDHPHSKEASHYLFFSWPAQKRIYTCKVPVEQDDRIALVESQDTAHYWTPPEIY